MKYKIGNSESKNGKKYVCICADKDTAVFAPKNGNKTSYTNMYARSQK
jgi:hypothetical protein